MSFALLRFWIGTRTSWEKWTLTVCAAVVLFVCIRVVIAPRASTVYPIFSDTGRLWWDGAEIYEPYRGGEIPKGYRYSPTFAVLIVPFAALPDRVGGVVWRLFNLVAMATAVVWFARAVLPQRLSANVFAGLILLTIPLTLQSFNNGQANLLVVGCMLASVAAVREERWWLASIALAIAFVCKVYPLALGFVLIVLYPRKLAWRIGLAVAVAVLLPFLCQDPTYVWNQHAHWIDLLRDDSRSHRPVNEQYRDLGLLIHIYGLPVTRIGYGLMQAAGGCVVAWVCWRRQRAGWPTSALLTATLALTATWMMLLGPATESSSFTLLAPSLAWSVVEAARRPARQMRDWLLWASCFLLALSVVAGVTSTFVRIHDGGVHAWGTIFYAVFLLLERRDTNDVSSPTSLREFLLVQGTNSCSPTNRCEAEITSA